MVHTGAVVCVVLIRLINVISAAENNEEPSSKDCNLYLAESTIPGAGFGVFTASNLPAGTVLNPEVAIPIINRKYEPFLWSDYVWDANSSIGIDDEKDKLEFAVPGVGAAANCNFALINAEVNVASYGDAGLYRGQDEGAGAFSSFHNKTFSTIVDVPAGAEIFIDYGPDYFPSRRYQEVPLKSDYLKANLMLVRLKRISASLSHEMKSTLFEVITDFISDSTVQNAFPRTLLDAEDLMRIGMQQSHLDKSIRTIEWLRRNGKCMDNISPRQSTVSQAGRGAFATRLIKKGHLIAPAPVIHLPERDVLSIYNEGTANGPTRGDLAGHQLLLNYCFGHGNSSVLVCPYGAGTSFINHDSKSPNAEIVWTHENSHWQTQSIQELKRQKHAGLSFDFMATRDIYPGDEVFINYGQEWESAWDQHLRDMQEWVGSRKSQSAGVLGKNDDGNKETQMKREISMVELENTGDRSLPGVFRHEMMMPDDVFPKAWMR